VSIDPTVNGEFSLWDGAITGRFLELEPSTKIVQEWYFGETDSPSIVTLKLHEHKKGHPWKLGKRISLMKTLIIFRMDGKTLISPR
jgi:activator of HSP90 ATPase